MFCFSDCYYRKKKDGSVKLALESGELNKQVHKNKYQMPNIEKLVDAIWEVFIPRKNNGRCFLPRWI